MRRSYAGVTWMERAQWSEVRIKRLHLAMDFDITFPSQFVEIQDWPRTRKEMEFFPFDHMMTMICGARTSARSVFLMRIWSSGTPIPDNHFNDLNNEWIIFYQANLEEAKPVFLFSPKGQHSKYLLESENHFSVLQGGGIFPFVSTGCVS